MGDEAVRIAPMASRHSERGRPQRAPTGVRHLGVHARGTLHDALDAFARVDDDRGVAVVAEDQSVDRKYESLTRELITFMMEDPRAVPHALDVYSRPGPLERLGDRSCNICAYLIDCERGKDVCHVGLDSVLREASDKY